MMGAYCTDMHRGEEPPSLPTLPGRAAHQLLACATAEASPRMDTTGLSFRVLEVQCCVTYINYLCFNRILRMPTLYCCCRCCRFQATFRSPIPTIEVEKTTRELEIFASQCSDIVIPESMPK